MFGWFVFFSVEGKVNLSHVPCLGCYHPIPGDSLQLLPILRYAIRIFNKQSDQSSLFEVGEVIKASRQVVAGWNYAVEYEVKETSCTKSNFQDLSPECKPIVGGHVGTCEAKAYVDLNNTIVDVAQKCKFPVDETAPPRISICAGCPKPIPTNSTELEEPLRASLEKYNEESNDVFYYKAEAISHATVQVVAGLNYNITFRIRKTNCSKTVVEKLSEDCVATIDGVSQGSPMRYPGHLSVPASWPPDKPSISVTTKMLLIFSLLMTLLLSSISAMTLLGIAASRRHFGGCLSGSHAPQWLVVWRPLHGIGML
uniref:Kininogen 1 n=1 Tax=Chelonoidis abingdonii TaxID=106734 RepID=A0A8C0H1T7_CHEAB